MPAFSNRGNEVALAVKIRRYSLWRSRRARARPSPVLAPVTSTTLSLSWLMAPATVSPIGPRRQHGTFRNVAECARKLSGGKLQGQNIYRAQPNQRFKAPE